MVKEGDLQFSDILWALILDQGIFRKQFWKKIFIYFFLFYFYNFK